MKRLTYISKYNPQELSSKHISDIVDVAVRNNDKRGLTGVLLALDGCFLQSKLLSQSLTSISARGT
jgi:hypothetical protein